MSFGSNLKQFVESILRGVAISSASPNWVNRVRNFDWFSEPDNMDTFFSQDVTNIIKAEIKIQMKQWNDPIVDQPPIPPTGSVGAELTSNVRKGMSMMQNPAVIATDLLRFLPHTALVALAISIAPMIIDLLTKPGGAMDVRWRRVVEDEMNGFLDRQTQKSTQMGLRQVVIQSRAGFISINGANNSNNLRFINQGGIDGTRLDRIGIDSFAKGAYSAR